MRIINLNMAEKFYKNEKFQEIFYPVLYIILSIALVVSGIVIFYNTYYTSIYVHGSSMMPTLLGAYTSQRSHYGIADTHNPTINNMKRFDVAITYYPSDWISGDEDTTYKIKRVWGFPGERITLTHDEENYVFTVFKGELIHDKKTGPISTKTFNLDGTEMSLRVATFSTEQKSFNVNITSTARTFDVTLGEDEYFLMGDNWNSSSDSYTHLNKSTRITRKDLQGKVVCIQGTAIYDSQKQKLVNKKRIRSVYYF